MNFKNNYLIIAIVLVAIIILSFILLTATTALSEKTYINVTDDGAIKFDTTGFEVNEKEVIEEEFTGRFVNKTFYDLKDIFGREAEITIHHSSMDDPESLELEYMNSEFYRPMGMWIGNYSGNYYSVVVSDSTDEDYFDSEFISSRIIIDQ